MHETGLLLTLTASLAAALALGFITERIGLSPIIGYLAAGILVGPYTPGFVADRAVAAEFAEIGIILLMFGVGLHFHLKDLVAVRTVAITGALAQIAVATALGALLGRMLGWSTGASLVFGLSLSVASTVMLTRVLADNQAIDTPIGRISIGWLVVEDIFTVIVLVLLPALFAGGAVQTASIATSVVGAVGKLALLVVFAFLVGGRLIPRVMRSVAATRSRELFTLTVLVLALGIAVGSALAFGVSMALGAFLAGMIVGQSEFSFRAASDALPMRDAFAVLFFVSMGMLFDPAALVESRGLLLETLAIILAGKPLAAFFIVMLLGHGSRIGAGVAVVLAQIGEFSLILATAGDQLNILPQGVTSVVVAAAIVSLALNPLLYRAISLLEPKWKGRAPESSAMEDHATYPAVVVGYGPIGQLVARLLQYGDVPPVIIEMNVQTARRVKEDGYPIVHGDASRPGVLEAAGIDAANVLVIAGPTAAESAEIIRNARSLNPTLRVLARAVYLGETERMRAAGADEVFSGEGEVALAMSAHIMAFLGASPEQIDRERQRVRREMLRREAKD
ncbi:MAG TPA: cation:proton antiporter [Terriglobia bacterium]|nr:cation:proton antiporter [Terriglobia bacterium]